MAGRNSCFVRSDANDDGTLTRSEVRRLFQARPAEQLEASLSRLDRDRDGQISREEFDRESAAVFQFLDTNGERLADPLHLALYGDFEGSHPFVIHHQRLDLIFGKPGIKVIGFVIESGFGVF